MVESIPIKLEQLEAIENKAKKEVFDDIEKEVLSKIRIDEDRYFFWKEIFNPLKKKHLRKHD